MDNQHRKISGYRELTEAAILDEVKEMPGIDQRALAIARTELQTGLMWAVRAVARPQGF